MTAPTVSPLGALREATRALHERIDASAFAQALRDGSLSMLHYGSFLRAVSQVVGALEDAVEHCGDAAVRAAYAHGVERRHRLTDDLEYLRVDPRGVDAAVLHALVLAQRMRFDALRGSAMLFGYLYVLEGAQLGGLAQVRALEKRRELAQGGLGYLSGAGRDTQRQFRAFGAQLAAALSDEAAVAAAITGATHAFEGFDNIVEAVMSERLEGRWLTEALNVDAGTHPLPSDVRELQAVLRAGEQSYRAWAYYGERYGERGLRFTRSDSAWLVTLAREDAQLALHHIQWLGRVLAARGMPSLLLELHLEKLHAQLAAALPERAQAYASLRQAAKALRSERLRLLSELQLDALARSFSAADEAITAREAGTLVVAAVLDEKRGVAQAVQSLVDWLGDPARFSEPWRLALERTLHDARAV